MRVFASIVVALVAGCGHFSVRSAESAGFEATQYAPARLTIEGALPVARVEGTPEEIGAQLGSLTARATKDLLETWVVADFFRELFEQPCASVEQLATVVPDRYRRELEVHARIAGVDSATLLRANAVVDACGCTAFAASGTATGGAPLLVGRNLDFAPANVLGSKTLVTIYRPEGCHAFAAIGWPGFAAVASGLNDAGLGAFILVNSGTRPRGDGVPLGFLVRRLLEECSSVEEARRLFRESPPASGHFVFLADSKTAAIVSRDIEDRSMQGGLLGCTNGVFQPDEPIQHDARARLLDDLLARSARPIDVSVARSILAATSMDFQSTHSMIVEPATRTLWVARGTTFEPAPAARWDRLDLGELTSKP